MTDLDARLARQIRTWRERRGWTRDQLADRCASVGGPGVTAEVILNIEGRRSRGEFRHRSASPWELMVLARALEVAPVALLFPVGEAELSTVPGENGPLEVDTQLALTWFTGELDTPADAALDQDRYGRGDQNESGLYEWYESPDNEVGAMHDIRQGQERFAIWHQMSVLVRLLANLYLKAETQAARDVYRATAHLVLEVTERWWSLQDDSRANAERRGAKLSPQVQAVRTRDELHSLVASLGDVDA